MHTHHAVFAPCSYACTLSTGMACVSAASTPVYRACCPMSGTDQASFCTSGSVYCDRRLVPRSPRPAPRAGPGLARAALRVALKLNL
eukprot:224147-Rhodomonas_salina.2